MYIYIYSRNPYLRDLSIAVADINTAVCKLPITLSISNFSSDFDSFAGTVSKAPKTIGTITIFTLNCLLTPAAKSMYLSIFYSSFSLT